MEGQSLIERLRALSRHEHSDYSIGEEAAAALEAVREEVAKLRERDVRWQKIANAARMADMRAERLEEELRDLSAKWRASADQSLERPGVWLGQEVADRYDWCADEIDALLRDQEEGK